MKSIVRKLDHKRLAMMVPSDRKAVLGWITNMEKESALKPMGDFAVGKNDPSLAHGSAKHITDDRVVKNSVLKLIALFDRAGFIKVKDVQSALKGMSEYVLMEQIERPDGSRNRAYWLILMPGREDSILTMTTFSLEKGDISTGENGIHISSHALARVMQRATSCSDTVKAFNMAKPHLVTAANLLLKGELDNIGLESFHVGNCDGKLIFTECIHGGHSYGWLAKTWLSPTMYEKDEREITTSLDPNVTWLAAYCRSGESSRKVL